MEVARLEGTRRRVGVVKGEGWGVSGTGLVWEVEGRMMAVRVWPVKCWREERGWGGGRNAATGSSSVEPRLENS